MQFFGVLYCILGLVYLTQCVPQLCVSLTCALVCGECRNQAEIARLLLSKGASVNLLNNSMCTALHIAVNKGFTDVVRVLTEHSADVNLQVITLHINISVRLKMWSLIAPIL